jgi:hypothetical protein
MEHMLAYVMAIAAIALGTIGLLVGFDILASGDNTAGQDLAAGEGNFWDGLLWIVPGISAAMLSFALHRTDHHLSRNPMTLDSAHKGMWSGEHAFAWIVGLGTIALGTIGLLVGFDVFDNGNTAFDGLLWSFASLGGSVLTNTLHSVRHHQLATDEDYILSVVEKNEGRRTTTGTTEVARERNR